jgi:putative peptide zinc metalloprotease protein
MTEGREYYVIKDPITGSFFRFQQAEHFITRLLDGETPIPIVREKVEAEFGAHVTQDTIDSFLRTLGACNLLESDGHSGQPRGSKPGRLRGNLFQIRLTLFDPNAFFNRILPALRFFFTPGFCYVSACVVLMGVAVLFMNWGEFTADIAHLYQFSTIPLFVAVMFLLISMHECAHGITCKYFGGDVHEIGMMLMYFQPALFCNVSDAWLFPDKSKRLLVGLAGPYFEIFLWGIAVLMWRTAVPDTLFHTIAVIVMAGSGIKALFNFNPLIKLDGYYLLSDYLEMPNLWRKSFAYVGSQVRRFFGSSVDNIAVSPRERRVFLLYGALASIGSFTLLGYVFLNAGGYLVETNQPLTFALLTGLLGFRLRQRLGRLFRPSSSTSGMADDDDSGSFSPSNGKMQTEKGEVAQTIPDTPPTVKRSLERRRRGRSFWPLTHTRSATQSGEHSRSGGARRRRLIWLAIAASVFFSLWILPMELRVAGPFVILPVHYADVRTEIEGVIREILITEGETVLAGQVIARLSDRELQNELQKTGAEIRQTRAKLTMQLAGPTLDEVEVARAAVQRTRDRMAFANGRLERDRQQVDRGLISQKEFELTQEQAANARNDHAEAASKLNVVLNGTREEEIDATRAEIARLTAQEIFLQDQLKRIEVRSPVSGIVATPARQLHELEHQLVQKGALLAKVYNFKILTVEIAVPEKEIAEIQIGLPVAFKAQAYPNETFSGKVTSIATTASGSSNTPGSSPGMIPSVTGATNSGRSILVTTEVENSSMLLKPGMTGQAKVYCGEKQIIDLITRRLARTVRVEFWSWW